MSTAQVFQAARSTLPVQEMASGLGINDPALLQSFADFTKDRGTSNIATGMGSAQLDALSKGLRLSADDWNNAFQSYLTNSNTDANPDSINWWGPEAKTYALTNGLGYMFPQFAGLAGAITNRGTMDTQQHQIAVQRQAEQNKGGGDDFLGGILPILSIAGLAMGFPGLLDLFGGGAAAAAGGGISDAVMLETALGGNSLATGGMSFAPSAFSSAFVPNASVIPGSVGAGSSAGLLNSLAGPSLASLGELGINTDMLSGGEAGGTNYLQNLTPLDASEFGTPNSVREGPMGLYDQAMNYYSSNPWIRNVLGGVKGAAGNRNNPLLGALMGSASAFMPGTGGPLSNALGMGSGLVSMMQGMDMNRRGRGMSNLVDSIVDPYASIRSNAATRLNALAANPGEELARLPGYRAGLDAITRQRAAMGQLGSGNLATALLDYGGNIYNQERSSLINQLGMGDPTALARMKMQALSAQGGGNPAILNGLATLGFGLNRMGV